MQGHIACLIGRRPRSGFPDRRSELRRIDPKRLKGPGRPVNDQQSRATVMAALLMVDAVTFFDEDTPLELINAIRPDVLVKGGDYTLDQIVVLSWGGRVVINPIVTGFSTTGILEKINKL
jgi:rfaE bifunctional protein nucleotidyltransferase chain/domain